MAMKFLSVEDQIAVGIQLDAADVRDSAAGATPEAVVAPAVVAPSAAQPNLFAGGVAKTANDLTMTFNNTADAPSCSNCGSIMVRNAACYKCLNCGETSGCS
jgi:ribonucleoside-diphosphate reductase alpha chain